MTLINIQMVSSHRPSTKKTQEDFLWWGITPRKTLANWEVNNSYHRLHQIGFRLVLVFPTFSELPDILDIIPNAITCDSGWYNVLPEVRSSVFGLYPSFATTIAQYMISLLPLPVDKSHLNPPTVHGYVHVNNNLDTAVDCWIEISCLSTDRLDLE